MDLVPGFNALTWTAPTQVVGSSDIAASLLAAYAVNPQSSLGYVSYVKGDNYNTLGSFVAGINYLVKMGAAMTTASASPAPVDAFPAFPGYTPAQTPNLPAQVAQGTTSAVMAAQPIIGGRLVAQTDDGLVPYSARTRTYQSLLLGLALNSALAGGVVTVLRIGYGNYPGLGLVPGSLLFAGDNGQLVRSTAGMAFSQLVGRALSADEVLFRPESIVLLAQ